ncbi:hypothetical protein ACFQGE_16840 [Halomicroarcula sp. GCM10025817]|jgi:predicted small metal-binding protein|uniref:hypothetical protein n=1 Tax=Haloarcula TaxID=2237 RepID=UPI0023E81747|nr:hypothetical protein [Halomicroarcula sp. SYNS111]
MLRCSHEGCAWRAIAPSEAAARAQLADHVATEHATTVDADIPDGKVQVRLDGDDEWQTVTLEEAHELHRDVHDD